MTLIPIEHPHRLASPEEAAVFFRAFGERRVGVRGLHTADPARVAAIVAAVDVKREHTVSWQGGALTAEARAALDVLALARYQYLDLRVAGADLRIWPWLRSWVQTMTTGDASEDLATFETQDRVQALARFHAVAGTAIARGFVMGLRADARAALTPFLLATGARVDVVLELAVAVARDLTVAHLAQPDAAPCDWQVEGALVDFPSGRIHGFLVTPKVEERHRARWLRAVDKALARARLG